MRRRTFLELLGLSGVGAGLSGIGARGLFAQDAMMGPPKRLIVISHCHGWPYDAWKLRPEGLGTSDPWEVDLAGLSRDAWPQPLAPLFEHRARLLALDGLSLATAELDMDGNRHDTGWVHAWTGNWADFAAVDTRARSASLDQIVAAHVGRGDRLPSLELSIDDIREGGRPISYAASGARLPVENTPDRIWQRLFGPSQAPDPLASRRKGVLDFAYGEFRDLDPSLAAGERDKIATHFDLLSDLTNRLDGMASLACDSGGMPGTQTAYDDRFDANAQLVAAAFSCDITRVVSMSLGEMPTTDFGWDHVTDDVHKGLAHEIYNDAEKHQAMTDYLTMHAQQVAGLVSTLESLPEGDGTSVMDNTMIVWGSELGDGWHGYQHYCPLIIGGSWHFRTGRYLHWPHRTGVQLLTPTGYSSASGMPHQRFLVSAAQAMGVETDHVGIKYVQSQAGEHIACTGPLPKLR
jgi:hypothetical protein